jgi:hypothetical protein
MRTFAAIALVGVLVGGCATPLPTPSTAAAQSLWPSASSFNPNLHIANGTALTVSLVVNGRHVGDFPPNGADRAIDAATLAPLPWTVEARSASGRVLVSLLVQFGDGSHEESRAQFADLSCGRIWIWVGDVMPEAPRPPSRGQPGDCAS